MANSSFAFENFLEFSPYFKPQLADSSDADSVDTKGPVYINGIGQKLLYALDKTIPVNLWYVDLLENSFLFGFGF